MKDVAAHHGREDPPSRKRSENWESLVMREGVEG